LAALINLLKKSSIQKGKLMLFLLLADPDKEPLDACKRKEAFQRVRKWTRKLNLLQKDYIFIPVNYKEVATYQEEVAAEVLGLTTARQIWLSLEAA
ncbi:probable ubiquitin-like-specific protease 2B isoform X2, partial [Tanacetum coccineum]